MMRKIKKNLILIIKNNKELNCQKQQTINKKNNNKRKMISFQKAK